MLLILWTKPAIMPSHFIVSKPFSLLFLSLSLSDAILLLSISRSLCFVNTDNTVYTFNLHPLRYIITHDEIVIHIILKPISSAWIYNEEWTITQTNMFYIEMEKTSQFVAAYWSYSCIIEVRDDIHFWETSHTCKVNSSCKSIQIKSITTSQYISAKTIKHIHDLHTRNVLDIWPSFFRNECNVFSITYFLYST